MPNLKIWTKPSIDVTLVKLAQYREVAHTDFNALHVS